MQRETETGAGRGTANGPVRRTALSPQSSLCRPCLPVQPRRRRPRPLAGPASSREQGARRPSRAEIESLVALFRIF